MKIPLANSFVQSGIVNEAEGWVGGFNPTILNNAQTQAQTALQNYITQNLPNATVGDILGGRKTIIQSYPTLPSSMANTIVATGARYGTLPSTLQHRIDLAFSADLYGEPINPVSFPWSQLNNQKISAVTGQACSAVTGQACTSDELRNVKCAGLTRLVTPIFGVLISTIFNLIDIAKNCNDMPVVAAILVGFLVANIIFEIMLVASGVGFVASFALGVVFGQLEDKALTYVKEQSCRR